MILAEQSTSLLHLDEFDEDQDGWFWDIVTRRLMIEIHCEALYGGEDFSVEPPTSGAVVVRADWLRPKGDRWQVRCQWLRLWSQARGWLPGVPALKGMVASPACLGAARNTRPGPNRRSGSVDDQRMTCQRWPRTTSRAGRGHAHALTRRQWLLRRLPGQRASCCRPAILGGGSTFQARELQFG